MGNPTTMKCSNSLSQVLKYKSQINWLKYPQELFRFGYAWGYVMWEITPCKMKRKPTSERTQQLVTHNCVCLVQKLKKYLYQQKKKEVSRHRERDSWTPHTNLPNRYLKTLKLPHIFALITLRSNFTNKFIVFHFYHSRKFPSNWFVSINHLAYALSEWNTISFGALFTRFHSSLTDINVYA